MNLDDWKSLIKWLFKWWLFWVIGLPILIIGIIAFIAALAPFIAGSLPT